MQLDLKEILRIPAFFFAVAYACVGKAAGMQQAQLRASLTEIVIDSARGASFLNGITPDQALTLLHELGHVYSLLFGPGSTKIADDGGNTPASIKNSQLIKDNCFK